MSKKGGGGSACKSSHSEKAENSKGRWRVEGCLRYRGNGKGPSRKKKKGCGIRKVNCQDTNGQRWLMGPPIIKIKGSVGRVKTKKGRYGFCRWGRGRVPATEQEQSAEVWGRGGRGNRS